MTIYFAMSEKRRKIAQKYGVLRYKCNYNFGR